MFSYIAFISGETKDLGDEAFSEGQALAHQCLTGLRELGDQEQFPPRLLILFTPPHYRNPAQAKELLAGIRQTFKSEYNEDVPLIGGSAVSVFFKQKVHPRGALLICLASRLFTATVAASENTSVDPDRAIEKMLKDLGLRADQDGDVNPFANLLLFALFPGFRNKDYPATKLYEMMQDKMRARAPIFGGVTSANDPERIVPGLQYLDSMVHQDAVVAAGITSGTPLGLSFAHGLTPTSEILQVSEVDSDAKIIKRFHQGSAWKVITEKEKRDGVVLLENISSTRHSWMGQPEPVRKKYIKMLREVEENAAFRIWQPKPRQMHKNIARELQHSVQRIRLKNAIGCLGIRCAGYPWIAKRIRLGLERELKEIEGLTTKYVGAFMAGEAGTDSFGRSYLSNWHTATLIFGDELRDRSTFHTGFIELAKFARGPALQTPNEAFARLLQMVYRIGYPGAMISLVLHDSNQEMIIAQGALGTRFRKIVKSTRKRSDGEDLLAVVLKSGQPKFVRESIESEENDSKALSQPETLGQYIIPLITLRAEVIALLQIDLGNVHAKTELHQNEQAVLDALGSAVSSSLNRVFNWEENKIVRGLDKALKDCLSKPTIKNGLQCFLERALKAFGLEVGHIRVCPPGSSTLRLEAGKGDYAQLAAKYRPEIDESDPSPSIRAFLKPNVPIVTNDAEKDLGHTKMSAQYSNVRWSEAMAQVGSYVNVGFISGSGERGTISLIAKSPWFFNWFHERACLALGERVGFIVEHLRRKEEEATARTRRRAVRTKVALVAQSAHRFKALLGKLQVMPGQITNAKGEALQKKITELSTRIEESEKEVTRRLDLAEKASRVNLTQNSLGPFVKKTVKRLIEGREIDYEIRIDDELTIEMDRDLMREVFINLVDNALDAFAEKALNKRRPRRPRLEIVADTDETNVRILFKDNGKGMRERKLEEVKQAIGGHPNNNRRAKSRGLGLPITSMLLDAHGGKIEDIESHENRGTTVTIVLPVHP